MLNKVIMGDDPQPIGVGNLKLSDFLEATRFVATPDQITILQDREDECLVTVWLPDMNEWEVWYYQSEYIY